MPNFYNNGMINASFRSGSMTPCSNDIFISCISMGTRMLSSTFGKEVGIGSNLQEVVLDSMIIFLTSSFGVGVRDSSNGVGAVFHSCGLSQFLIFYPK